MDIQPPLDSDRSDLRRRAEAVLKIRPPNLPQLFGMDTQALIYELQVHQVELELQHEDLRLAQEGLAALYQRYVELYELAPLGYFTLNSEGLILGLNQSGAELLGVERGVALRKPFDLYLEPNDQDRFYQHLRKFFISGQRIWIEVRMLRPEGKPFPVRLDYSLDPSRRDAADQAWIAVRDLSERVDVEEKLRSSEQKFRRYIEYASDGIFCIDSQGRITEWNTRQEEITGLLRANILGRYIWDVQYEATPPAERQGADAYQVIKARLQQLLQTDSAWRHSILERQILRPDGQHRTVQEITFPIHTEQSFAVGCLTRDVTAIKHSQQLVQDSERRFYSLFEDSPVSLWEENFISVKRRVNALRAAGVTDFRAYFEAHPQLAVEWLNDLRVTDLNQATLRMFKAHSKEELIERLPELMLPGSLFVFGEEILALAEGRTRFESEVALKTLAGDVLQTWMQVSLAPGSQDSWAHVLVSFLDITVRKQAEEQFKYFATHDSLTGLPNRALFYDRLSHALNLAHRSQQGVAVVFMDLDNFKAVNDTFGHETGDEVLKLSAARLVERARQSDTVARLAGDEFLLILEQIHSRAEAEAVAAQLEARLAEPFDLDGRVVTISATSGVSLFPDDGGDPESLVKKADEVMYGKKRGLNQNDSPV